MLREPFKTFDSLHLSNNSRLILKYLSNALSSYRRLSRPDPEHQVQFL